MDPYHPSKSTVATEPSNLDPAEVCDLYYAITSQSQLGSYAQQLQHIYGDGGNHLVL